MRDSAAKDIVAQAATQFCTDHGADVRAAFVRSPNPCFECGCDCQVKNEPLRVDVQLFSPDMSVINLINLEEGLQAELNRCWPRIYLAIVESMHPSVGPVDLCPDREQE